MKNVKKLDPQGTVQNMHCWFCKELVLRFGSFNPKFPECKELFFVGDYKREKIEYDSLTNPDGVQIGWLVKKCRCDNCGNNTKFIILFNADVKMMVKR